MTLDMTDSIAPKSDQMNSDDLLSGPRTFTVADVRLAASGEQPIDVHLAEFPRPFRPSKSMRRVMVAAWGKDASTYAGKRLTLFRDPDIKFGGQAVGGIRISALSHIGKPMILALTETRGKKAQYRVAVLADDVPATPTVSPELLATLTAMFTRKGIPEESWLAGVNHYTGGAATDLEVITEDQARQMLKVLDARPDVASAAVEEPIDNQPQQLAPDAWNDVQVAQPGGQP